MKDKIEAYFNLQQEIFEYFGYKEDWRVIPLDVNFGSYWYLTGEGHGHSVYYGDEPLTQEIIDEGNVYSAEIYAQRFLPKWVYRGPELTMIVADTHVDCNKFLMIFENDKECKL